jgi:RND family efflux transporter MFP subunit
MQARVSAVLLATLVACSQGPAPEVDVSEARRAPLRVSVTTNGKVEPIDEAEVRARLGGRVLDIPDPGTQVKAGEVLLRIDASPVAEQLAAAESESLAARESLEAARRALAVAQRSFETDQGLFAEGAITRQRFEESEAVYRSAKARADSLSREVPLRLDSLALRIGELRDQVAGAEVLAPISGTVYRTDAKKGQVVRAGDTLLALADLERLRVRANVDQVDLGRVETGDRVRITSNAHPGQTWSGRVSELIPNVVVKESRAVAESLTVLEPPVEGLVPGMTVDVEITVAESPETLQVPADAVVSRGGESLVYRLDGSRVRATPVRVGISSVTATEVLEGLSPGDRVVVGGAQALEDGARVRVRDPDARAS